MAVADTKKVQTMINIIADEVVKLKAAATRLEAVRTAFTAHNPSVAGTPLAGNVAAVSAWIDSVRAAADGAVAAGLLAAKVPSHRGKALGEEL